MKKIIYICVVLEFFLIFSTGMTLDNAELPLAKKSTNTIVVYDVLASNEEPEEEQAIIINPFSEEEIYLMALVTVAEAEGECEYGQRLVIDTILNRLDSDKFPDTISDVIYQPNQFTSMWNGRIDRCTVTDYFLDLVRDEIESRSDYDVVFFRTTRYSDYGTPKMVVEDHYFSSI